MRVHFKMLNHFKSILQTTKEFSPTQPAAFGEAIEVPLINIFLDNVQFGTDVIAQPGAVTDTPREPSTLKQKSTPTCLR